MKAPLAGTFVPGHRNREESGQDVLRLTAKNTWKRSALDKRPDQVTMDHKLAYNSTASASLLNQRGWFSRLVELGSVAAFFALQLAGWQRLSALDDAGALSWLGTIVLAAICAWLLADLASGLVHYFADNVGGPETPLVGPLLIAPFREHHEAPEAMLEHGFLQRNANNALIVLPAFGWVPFVELDGLWMMGAAVCSLLLGWWIFLTNQIHAWAHSVEVPRLVRGLQNLGVLLSFAQHDRHHQTVREARAGSHYCITSGVCDRVSERVRLGLLRLKKGTKGGDLKHG